ncbi:MAG: hypothetical protein ACOVOT_16940 [Rubrivivax sp.]|jgi:hypothetical protein|nr:hypothetical protein [Rubrivivax sp.]
MNIQTPRMRDRADSVLRWAAVISATLLFAAVCEPLWASVDDATPAPQGTTATVASAAR